LGVGVEPVWEAGNTRPYDAFEDLSFLVQEDTLVASFGERLVCEIVIFLLLVGNSRVDHDHVVLVVLVQVVDDIPHSVERETVRIEGHDVSVVHVVDVSPHSLQRNAGGRVVGDNLSNGVEISVSVSALVQAKAPVGHHNGQASDFSILLADLRRSLTSHEVEINDTTKDVVLEVLLTVLDVNLDIHAGAGQKEDTMSAALATVLEVDGVSSVEVCASWNSVRVTVPEGADVVGCVQPKTIRVLSQTVQVRVLRKRSAEAEVLVLEDEGGRGRVEEDFFIRLPGDLEAEWALFPGEVEFRVVGRDAVGLWTGEDVVGDLVGGQWGIFDLDMEALCFVRVSILQAWYGVW
jgi:hypothetical protein